MEKVSLSSNLNLSRIVHGHWRLVDWNLTKSELEVFINETMNLGITSFDHADIYGDYQCEEIFGNVLKGNNALRDSMEIITKCGIKLPSPSHPERTINTYDYSKSHIVQSVESSLIKLNTDRIDLLLLHRPSPFINPVEVCEALTQLKDQGKVLNFGVSNFTPGQFDMLSHHLGFELVTNQVELSPYCLEHFDNGNMDFFMKHQIHPMAWSPVAGGNLFQPTDKKGKRLLKELQSVQSELDVNNLEEVIYGWILKHPSKPLPIVGSGNLSRIKKAVDSLGVSMTMEQWFRIYNASKGCLLP